MRSAQRSARRALAGRTVWTVNSTPAGGGVATMLHTLLPYLRGSGIDARWVVVSAPPQFFAITKRIHNRIHGHVGDRAPLGAAEGAVYERVLASAASELAAVIRSNDVVILHDPQTAGIVGPLKATGATVLWRSHVGADRPNALVQQAWDFLLPYLAEADAFVFLRPAYVPRGLPAAPTGFISPSIDPCDPKSQPMPDAVAGAILEYAGIARPSETRTPRTFTKYDGTEGAVGRPAEVTRVGQGPQLHTNRIVLHVSRWDRLKDPAGVMRSFVQHTLPIADAHLILAGPAALAVSDDPEAAEVFDEVRRDWSLLEEPQRKQVELVCLPVEDLDENAAIVNALQRQANVVVKKSLEEAFGLGVTEAMWKRRPVVATRVGGIRDQVQHGVSGLLVDDPTDLAAFGLAVGKLLHDEQLARRFGRAARARVRARYLPDRQLSQWLELLTRLVDGSDPVAPMSRPGVP